MPGFPPLREHKEERAVVFKTEDFAKLMVEHRQMNAGLQDEVSDSPSAAPDELDVAIRQHVRRVFAKYGENVSKAAAAASSSRSSTTR